MAYGLPVEGDDGPFAGERATEVPTVSPDDPVSAALERLGDAPRAVVTTADGVVLGLVEREALQETRPETAVAAVMALSPTSVRPSVEYATLVEQGDEPVLVTTPDGRLVGMVEPEHDDADAGRDLERSLLDTIEAVQEHFGDRDVSEDDIRSFLRDRLVAEGKSPEEADRFVATMADERTD